MPAASAAALPAAGNGGVPRIPVAVNEGRTHDSPLELRPQLLLLGAQKGATSSLFKLLIEGGVGVCGMNGPDGLYVKEAHFFDLTHDAWKTANGTKYQEKFVEREAKRGLFGCSQFLDATPNYLLDVEAPHRMVHAMPLAWVKAVKMIAVLREPIARDLSAYNAMKFDWLQHPKQDMTVLGSVSVALCGQYVSGHAFPTYKESVACHVRAWKRHCAADGQHMKGYFRCASYDSPAEVVQQNFGGEAPWEFNRLTNGMYLPQIRSYVDRFSREQLMVLNYDEMVSARDGAQGEHIRRILSFYGLHHNPALLTFPVTNALAPPYTGKVTAIDCPTRDALQAIFQPFNTELVEYLQSRADQIPPQEPRHTRASNGGFFRGAACAGPEEMSREGIVINATANAFDEPEEAPILPSPAALPNSAHWERVDADPPKWEERASSARWMLLPEAVDTR